MKQLYFISICATLFLTGCLFFFYQESWIVFTSPFNQSSKSYQEQQSTKSKTVTLYSLQGNSIKKETTDIIHSDNTAQNIQNLLNAWLLFLEDEHVTEFENKVISVALSPSKQEAFISLNQYPFDSSWSTYRKLMWTESLLKTIKDNNVPIVSVRLLVQHQPILDDHLNFTATWPLGGFINS